MILCSQIFTLQKSWWEAVQGIKPNPVFEAMRMLPEHGQAAFICGGPIASPLQRQSHELFYQG
jgi:hypothetical protein